MVEIPNNTTRQRLLDVAAELFASKGYAAVRLRDIAAAIGLRHASLYYYAPGGKEQLYVEVMERALHQHRSGLEHAVATAGADFRDQIYAIVDWLVSQPPVDITRMSHSDMPEIGAEQAKRLMELAYNSLRLPIGTPIMAAIQSGTIRVADPNLGALALVSLVESVHAIPVAYRTVSAQVLGRQLADMLLDGWTIR